MTPDKKQTELLKPCPLCGQSVGLYRLGDWNIIRCPCGLKIEKHLTAEELVALWNRRFLTKLDEPLLSSQPDDLFKVTFGE